MKVRTSLLAVLVLGAIAGAFLMGSHAPPALGRADIKADIKALRGTPHYSVVETEGHNLIVTDNTTNKLYFYTIDKDKEVGTELHLRGTVDLSQVGKTTIVPKHAKANK